MKLDTKVVPPQVLDVGPFMAGGQGQRRVVTRHVYISYYLISLYEEIGSGYFCSVLTAVAMICTACLKEPAHTTGKAGAVGSVGACGAHSKQEVENCRSYIMNNGLRRFGEKSPKLYHSASRVTLNSRFGGCIARALAC